MLGPQCLLTPGLVHIPTWPWRGKPVALSGRVGAAGKGTDQE